MADRTERSQTDSELRAASPFERFQSHTPGLLHVSKDDVREAEARDQDKRRTA